MRADARFGLFALLCLLLLALWVGIAWLNHHEREQALAGARRDVTNLARALGEHVLGTLRTIDQALLTIVRTYERDPTHFDAVRVFADAAVFKDASFLTTIIGADGYTVTSSHPLPDKPIYLGDREHFRVHLARDSGRLHIGKPVIGRVSGKWSLQLTRRINRPDGSFGGVAVISFDPEYLARFYQSMDMQRRGSAGVVGYDGVIRARRSGGRSGIGENVSGTPVFTAMSQRPVGVVEARSVLDGVDRIFGFRAVPEYDLIVNAGFAQDDVLAEQMDRWVVLGGLLVSLTLLTAGWVLIRQIDRVRRSEMALRRQEAELIAARERAEGHNEAKSRFLANMSHELRTPLNAILGYSEMIRDGLFGPIGTPRYSEYARDIHHSGTLLLSLISDILDLSKIESGRQAPVPEPIDLAELVQAAAQMVRMRANAKQIVLDTEIAPAARHLHADRRALHQVVLNLLTNAVKFTAPAGRVRMTAGIASTDGAFELSVTDTGVGIAPARLAGLFEPFQQRDATLASGQDGFGLGLSICKALVECMGGNIAIDSALGRGTAVTVRLPHQASVAAAA